MERTFISNLITNVGKREKNQDHAILMEAMTPYGHVLMAAVADGVGGLIHGEESSRIVRDSLDDWFRNRLKGIIYSQDQMIDFDDFRLQTAKLIEKAGEQIRNRLSNNSGTTLALILITDEYYFIMNVGDSRVYKYHKDSGFEILTHDQSVVQRGIDTGLLTLKEAELSEDKNVILQCIGATSTVLPEYNYGNYITGDSFIICSDGFYHNINEDNAAYIFSDEVDSDDKIKEKLEDTVSYVMECGETDNITSIAVKVI